MSAVLHVMIPAASMLLTLAGCGQVARSRREESSDSVHDHTVVVHPASGIHIANPGCSIPVMACTWQAFNDRFPVTHHFPLAEPAVIGAGGSYPGQSAEADSSDCRGKFIVDATGHASVWYICADPMRPTEDELIVRDHEIAHMVQRVSGWDAARPLWERIAQRAPWAMTHPEINARLKEASP